MTQTARDLLHIGIAELGQVAPSTANLEAGVLLAHLLGKPRSWLFAHPEAAVDDPTGDRFKALLRERASGVPVAYLTGEREFWSLSLRVTPDTLIPRPETELLVERALRLPLPGSARIADLGTGSGAISAAIASERPRWEIVATDASEAALAVAAGNFRRLGFFAIETRPGEWLQPLSGERFDLLVSNPPYVPEVDPHLLAGDVRREPRGALASGADGLDALRVIVADAGAHLRSGGWLLVEHGWNQGPGVRDLFAAAGFSSIATHRDFSGHERITEGRHGGD